MRSEQQAVSHQRLPWITVYAMAFCLFSLHLSLHLHNLRSDRGSPEENGRGLSTFL